MVDTFGSDEGAVQATKAASKTGRLPAFFGTGTGKLVLGALGVVVMLGILAAVVFGILLRPPKIEPIVTPTQSTATPGTASAEPAVPKSTKPLSTTFVFRDIFKPTLKQVSVAGGSTGGTGTGTDGGTGTTDGTGTSNGDGDGNGDDGNGDQTNVPEDTLVLIGVTTEDGEPVAQLYWNGTTYALGEGDQLGDTPWQVLEINGNTVVMLFGDSRVTLSVGQGVSK